eukprot:TRINITY_DN8028_c0_g1_i2.p1 TRINITY_DN8028_c0_g1~~TRINITY_DN8028_c0_g1_i2.p1  ORF type:complete len:106 (+),score=7.60 TRINITY_DN8028_c0_g1_i2:62-379(+)
MGRSRRAYRKARPTVRVGLPKHKGKVHRPAGVVLPGSEDRLQWNDKATLLDNYRALGILANPNVIGARSGSGKVVQLVSLQKPLSADANVEDYDSDKEPEGMLFC